MSTPESAPTHLPWVQPYARVDLNPAPESTLSPSQGLWIWPLVCARNPNEYPIGRTEACLLTAGSLLTTEMLYCSSDFWPQNLTEAYRINLRWVDLLSFEAFF